MKKFIFLTLLLTLSTNAEVTKIEDVDYNSLTPEQQVIYYKVFESKLVSAELDSKLKDYGPTERKRTINNFYNCVFDGVQTSTWAAIEGFPIAGFFVKSLSKAISKSFGAFSALLTGKSFDTFFDIIHANKEEYGENFSDELLVSTTGGLSYIADIAVYAYDVAKGKKSLETDPIEYHYFKYTFSDTINSAKDLMEGSKEGQTNSCSDKRRQVANIERDIKTHEHKHRQLEKALISAVNESEAKVDKSKSSSK